MGCNRCLQVVSCICIFLRTALGWQVDHAASTNITAVGANIPVFYHFRHRRHHLKPAEEENGEDAEKRKVDSETDDETDASAEDKDRKRKARKHAAKDDEEEDKHKDETDESAERSQDDEAASSEDREKRPRVILTCGGNQDTSGKKQMERENGKRCIFPFTYRGKTYNHCIEVDSPDKPWCQTSSREMEEEGIIRWGFCNPDRKPCPAAFQEDPVDVGRNNAVVASAHQLQHDEMLVVNWFTWEIWKPLVIIVVILFTFSELIGPSLEAGNLSFMIRSIVFAAQMSVALLAAYIFIKPGLAATHHILAIVTVNWALSIILLISGICIRMRNPRTVVQVMDDSSVFVSLYTRSVMVALLVYGIIDETQTQYASMATMAGLFAFGIAMASSGVFQDYVAYLYIRFDDVFEEDDVVNVSGERVVRVKRITVRHIEVESFDDSAPRYIPNRTVSGDCIVNLTRDTGRLECNAIPLDSSIPAKKLEAIVQGVYAVFKSSADGFTALDGTRYPCQFNIDSCHVFVGETPSSTKLQLNLRLRGKYWYSNPPPWTRGGEEPDAKFRDMEWFMPWQYQKEWFYIEVQKVLESQGALSG